jgi:hypothetical protein
MKVMEQTPLLTVFPCWIYVYLQTFLLYTVE